MKRNKNSANKDIKLTGRSRAEIISLLGDNYVTDVNGNIIYSITIFLFYKKKTFIGFNENDIADVVFTI